MHSLARTTIEMRVLVLAATPRDGDFARHILSEAGMEPEVHTEIEGLCGALKEGAGAMILPEEATNRQQVGPLLECLEDQEAWSDLPLIVMVENRDESRTAAHALETLGNVILLERPVRVTTLVGAVRSALRARARQYEIRDNIGETRRVAEDLDESREFLQRTLDALSAHIAILDENGVVLAVNKAWRRFGMQNGFTIPNSGIGANYLEVIETSGNEAGRQAAEAIRSVAIDGQAELSLEYPCHSKSERRWFLMRVTRFFSKGEPRIVVAHENISARVEAERAMQRSEERFRVMAETVPAVLFTADPHLNFDYTNQRFYDYTGVERGEAQNFGWARVVHPEDIVPVKDALVRAVERGESITTEMRLRRHDKSYRWFMARAHPIRDDSGTITRWFGSVTDIHDLKETQKELERSHETLERRVTMRTAELERRSEQLRAVTLEMTNAEQQERRRLAQMLHDDLQQLLVAAQMQLGRLRNRIDDETMKEWVTQTKQLIVDSIQTSRTLTAQLSPQILYEAGLTAGLQWLSEWMRETYSMKIVVRAEEDIDPKDETIRIFLFQSIRELLFNIVKHGQVDEAIVELKHAEGDRLEITVSDKGRGFDPEQVDPVESKSTGFGLFTIRERLEYLGGEMQIESSPGAGTSIRIRVPMPVAEGESELEPAEMEEAAAGFSSTQRSDGLIREAGKIRVVLADDHRIVREGIVGLLEDHEEISIVGEAWDGEMAVEMARRTLPDVVIMDINMPKMNGIEAARTIKAELPRTKVIGLSMHQEESMEDMARSAGMDVYLTKGGPSETLYREIRRLCEGQA